MRISATIGLGSFVALCLFISLNSLPNLAKAQTIDPPEDDEKEEIIFCTPNPQYLGIICSAGSIDCSPRNCP